MGLSHHPHPGHRIALTHPAQHLGQVPVQPPNDSFRGTQVLAAGLGLTVSVAGTTGSYYANTPSGGTIVLLAVTVFAVTAAGTGPRRHLHRRHPADTVAAAREPTRDAAQRPP